MSALPNGHNGEKHVPETYVAISLLPGDTYHVVWDEERNAYLVYADDPYGNLSEAFNIAKRTPLGLGGHS